jgi:gentisate 1,2-dioxygenase
MREITEDGMATKVAPGGPGTVEEMIDGFGQYNLMAGWDVLAQEVPKEPTSIAVPCHWRYSDVREQLFHAGRLVPPENAERRILVMANPGLDGRPATTPTIFTDMQLVLPGEETNIHRHTPSALRFMMEGEGSYAMTAGERNSQHKGDLVLGPSWGWHSHGNLGDDPAVWFDALDIPLVKMLDASFFEGYDSDTFRDNRPDDGSLRAYGNAGVMPTWNRTQSAATPVLKYDWPKARAALADMPDENASPYDDLILEYVNPLNGGPIMTSLSCHLQRIRPGVSTEAHRHTSSTVYVGAEGAGRIVIGDETYDWEEGDIVSLPSWCWHAHENRSASDDAVLFSVTDAPTLRALNLWREERTDA